MAMASSCSSSAESSEVSLISRRYVSSGDWTEGDGRRRVVLVMAVDTVGVDCCESVTHNYRRGCGVSATERRRDELERM